MIRVLWYPEEVPDIEVDVDESWNHTDELIAAFGYFPTIIDRFDRFQGSENHRCDRVGLGLWGGDRDVGRLADIFGVAEQP